MEEISRAVDEVLTASSISSSIMLWKAQQCGHYLHKGGADWTKNKKDGWRLGEVGGGGRGDAEMHFLRAGAHPALNTALESIGVVSGEGAGRDASDSGCGWQRGSGMTLTPL